MRRQQSKQIKRGITAANRDSADDIGYQKKKVGCKKREV